MILFQKSLREYVIIFANYKIIDFIRNPIYDKRLGRIKKIVYQEIRISVGRVSENQIIR